MCILGEDASCFSAKSVEQYYGWNIGKRRAAEVMPCAGLPRACGEETTARGHPAAAVNCSYGTVIKFAVFDGRTFSSVKKSHSSNTCS